jgi:hypothetical protein
LRETERNVFNRDRLLKRQKGTDPEPGRTPFPVMVESTLLAENRCGGGESTEAARLPVSRKPGTGGPGVEQGLRRSP